MEALGRRTRLLVLLTAVLFQGGRSTVSEENEIAKLYAQTMARCMAALSKLAYCNLPMDAMGAALQEGCGTPCSWAGMDLEPGSRLVAKSGEDDELDFGFVAKFKRAEGINEESMDAKGCIVALKVPDDETTAHEIAAVKVPQADEVRRLGLLLKSPTTLHLDASGGQKEGQGTHKMEVWETDALCKGCKVAASYKKAWDGLKPKVADHLSDAGCKPGDSVYVTGHSKGAALATLAMFSLQAQMGYDVQLSYNFESPRVGNIAFAEAFHQHFVDPKDPLRKVALYRITHGNDRAVREPSSKFGYMHVGHQVWYRKDGADSDFVVCGNATADPSCGVGGFNRSLTCPLKPSTMCVNRTCAEVCREDAPRGGPHCRNPLAPARNFCPFGENKTENWGSEWNEVVGKGGVDWEKSCLWGRPAAPPQQPSSEAAGKGSGTSTTLIPAAGGSEHQGGSHASQPPAVPSNMSHTCFADDVTYQPLDMLGHYFSAESDAKACQTRCTTIEGCAYFSFFPRGSSGDCHVTTAGAYRQKGSIGFVAGPRACADAMPEGSTVLGGFTNYGPGSTTWYLPGVAAGCILATYFSCLTGLALSGTCSARGRVEVLRSSSDLLRHLPGTANAAAAL